MTTPLTEAAFYHAVIDKMLAIDAPVHRAVLEYKKNNRATAYFPSHIGTQLVQDVCNALKNQLESDPAKAIELLAAITTAINENATGAYWDLTRALFDEDIFYRVWGQARDDDARYAFSLFFMLWCNFIYPGDDHAACVSTIVGKPFVFDQSARRWKEDFAEAMFGKAWYALYGGDDVGNAAIIESILRDRPPFDDGLGAEAPVSLPSSFTTN